MDSVECPERCRERVRGTAEHCGGHVHAIHPAGLAHALTCRDITNMVNVQVPAGIIVQTIRTASPVAADVPDCLAKEGAEPRIVKAARDAAGLPRVAPPPAPAPLPPSNAAARAAVARGDWAEVHRNVDGDTIIQGRYLDGVALAHLRRSRSALDAFSAVLHAIEAEAGHRIPVARAMKLDRDRDLAALGVARVYFGDQRCAEAARWGDLIGRRSPLWAEAQLEAAWADFYVNDDVSARSRLTAVRKARQWLPEVPVLELLVVTEWDRRERVRFPAFADPPRQSAKTPSVEPDAVDTAHSRLRAELEPARDMLAAVVAGNLAEGSLPAGLRGDAAYLLGLVEAALNNERILDDGRHHVEIIDFW